MPPAEGIVRIHWHKSFFNKPVYERGDGHIWSARTYCARLRDAGIRAGFPSLTNHDLRAEGLRATGKLPFITLHGFSLIIFHLDEDGSASQRRRQGGHANDTTYDRYYAPTNLGTDGQALFAGDTPRKLLFQLLRFLKMNHNPELAQTLPAAEVEKVMTSEESLDILLELENLPDSDDDDVVKKKRSEILGRLRTLKLNALKKYREEQKENPFRAAKTENPGHYRMPFSRIEHVMSIRKRLSTLLSKVDTIRSKVGRAVLNDLIELYRSDYEVDARSELGLGNCHCAVPKEYVHSTFASQGTF